MAGQGSARGGFGETMAEFLRARHSDLKHFGHDAEAAAREAYRRSIRDGEDLILKTSSDVMKYGAGLLGARKPSAQKKPTAPVQVTKVASASRPPTLQRPQRWEDNPAVRGLATADALVAGMGVGVIRGGVHSVEGLAQAYAFSNRLRDPTDFLRSPRGESAVEQLIRTELGAANYVRRGVADPQRVVGDVKAKAHKMRIDLDPTATPAEARLGNEMMRNFKIGMNQGELAFDVGSTLYGGPLAKTAKEVGLLTKAASYEKSIAQGKSPAFAEYLSEPYEGMGHHAVWRRSRKLPAILGGGLLPKKWLDSSFNVLAPKGITRAEMYELHYKVDPSFRGAKVPPEFRAEGWSGRKLGLKKYGPLGRAWYGTPAPFKARVGGFGAATGGMMYVDPSEEE